MNPTSLSVVVALGLTTASSPLMAQSATGPFPAQAPTPTPRPTPPTRDPNTPGYVTARELPDGEIPSADVDGNFIIGPTHNPAPDTLVQHGNPQGTIIDFAMSSSDSKIYPGIARDAGTFGTPDPTDPEQADRDHQPSRLPTRAGSRSMCPSSTSPEPWRPSSWARTARTRCSSPPSTISSRRSACP